MARIKIPVNTMLNLDKSSTVPRTMSYVDHQILKSGFTTTPMHVCFSKLWDTEVLLDEHHQKYGIYARFYNTNIGSGIEIRYYLDQHYALIPMVRTKRGYEHRGPSTTDVSTAIKRASALQGVESKKRTKDPKAKERMRWWEPREELITNVGATAYSNNLLFTAKCLGFCVIDVDTARVSKDVMNPNLSENLYFLVDVTDRFGRAFLLLLKEDCDKFMVAIQHNQNCIKLTGDDELFKTGSNPLNPGDLTITDLELVKASIRIFAE